MQKGCAVLDLTGREKIKDQREEPQNRCFFLISEACVRAVGSRMGDKADVAAVVEVMVVEPRS